MSRLEIHLFGSPRILHGGEPVEVDTRKATALLAYLALTGAPQQRDTLAALLWPDYDQSSARATLRRTLSTLNKALQGHHLDITRDNVGVALGSEHWIDVLAFQQAASATRQHGHGTDVVCSDCLPVLAEAARLYPQPFLTGFTLRDSPAFEEWQFFQEETLRRELANVLERLSFAHSQTGNVEDAITAARRWVALDPLVEEAHRALIRLYHQLGQRNTALRQYRECERILENELGVEPLEETSALYDAVLSNTPLPEPENHLRFAATAVEAAPTIPKLPAESQAPATAVQPQAVPLVGREKELRLLLDTYRKVAQTGDGSLVAITGEAGIGKSRLTEALRNQLNEQLADGVRWASGSCYRDESALAYAPFVEALSPLVRQTGASAQLRNIPPVQISIAARLFPELLSHQPALTAPGTQDALASQEGMQTQFFEALRQVTGTLLAGSPPGILFLDDLHWADSASLDLLAYLVRRARGMRLLIVATWRVDASATVETLERLLAERSRAGSASRVALERLRQSEVEELVRQFIPLPPAGLAERLYQETEGLPFFTIEYLRAQSLNEGDQELGWEMPASVRDLLHSRIEALDATAMQLLSAASIIGRSFDPAILREASGRSEVETIEGIERLLAAGLISEPPAAVDRYDFTHEKIRSLVYDETSQVRRRLLHRRVAETLARPSASLAERAGQAAYHFQQAGLPEQAAEYHLVAGEYARALFANAAALAHFRSALAAGHPDAAHLHEAIADLYTLRGEYHNAQQHYSEAAKICPRDCAASLEHKLGNVFQRMGEWELAEQHYAASQAARGNSAEAGEVALYTDRSRNAYLCGDLETAHRHAGQALALAQASGEAEPLAQAENILGLLAHARSDLPAAINHLEASLHAAATLADPLAQIAALNNLARALADPQAPNQEEALERAIRLTQQALALCQKRGDRHRQAALHNNLADLLHKAKREEEAMAQLKQAVVIFTEISAEGEGQFEQEESAGHLPLAAVWKLTEW